MVKVVISTTVSVHLHVAPFSWSLSSYSEKNETGSACLLLDDRKCFCNNVDVRRIWVEEIGKACAKEEDKKAWQLTFNNDICGMLWMSTDVGDFRGIEIK